MFNAPLALLMDEKERRLRADGCTIITRKGVLMVTAAQPDAL
ncbi:MAG: hypothetical protein V4794_03060 [Pseudomonadota bacterium]